MFILPREIRFVTCLPEKQSDSIRAYYNTNAGALSSCQFDRRAYTSHTHTRSSPWSRKGCLRKRGTGSRRCVHNNPQQHTNTNAGSGIKASDSYLQPGMFILPRGIRFVTCRPEKQSFDPCVFQQRCRSVIRLSIQPPRVHLAVGVPAGRDESHTHTHTHTCLLYTSPSPRDRG